MYSDREHMPWCSSQTQKSQIPYHEMMQPCAYKTRLIISLSIYARDRLQISVIQHWDEAYVCI